MTEAVSARRWFNTEIPVWGLILLLLGFGGWSFREYQNNRDTQVMVQSHSAQLKDMQDSLALVKQQSFILTENVKTLQEVREALKTIQELQRYQSVSEFRIGNLECKVDGQCGGRVGGRK